MGVLYDAKSKVVSFVSDIRFYWLGFVLFGNTSYQVKGEDMREILNTIEPGDVLLRRYSHYLGSVLIKGYYSHAALYVGDNSIVHMLGHGIEKEDILTFMRCDGICVLRPTDPSLIEPAIAKANKYLEYEIQYDYSFDTNNAKRLYCTEFADNVYDYPVRTYLGEKRKVLPDNFLEVDFFQEVYRTKVKK